MTQKPSLQSIIEQLNLKILVGQQDFSAVTPASGYTSDLLSCVMAGAKNQGVWVTLQAHANVIAVAALLDQCAVIITEDAQPEQSTLDKAAEQGITLLSTPLSSFEVVGRLYALGVPAE